MPVPLRPRPACLLAIEDGVSLLRHASEPRGRCRCRGCSGLARAARVRRTGDRRLQILHAVYLSHAVCDLARMRARRAAARPAYLGTGPTLALTFRCMGLVVDVLVAPGLSRALIDLLFGLPRGRRRGCDVRNSRRSRTRSSLAGSAGVWRPSLGSAATDARRASGPDARPQLQASAARSCSGAALSGGSAFGHRRHQLGDACLVLDPNSGRLRHGGRECRAGSPRWSRRFADEGQSLSARGTVAPDATA